MISVNVLSGSVQVTSPYCPEFVGFAKMRGGKWSDSTKTWMFDARDEFAVRSALIDIYGTDDYVAAVKVSLRANISGIELYGTDTIYVKGRKILKRTLNDNYKLGDGIILATGDINIGKKKVYTDPQTIIEIRDVPIHAAEQLIKEQPKVYKLIGSINKEKLIEEKELLLKRIRKIDATLEAIKDMEEADPLADLEDELDEPPDGSGGEAEA
jgi:hypothetical protein